MAHGFYVDRLIKIATTLYIFTWSFVVSACQVSELTPTGESLRTQISEPSEKSTIDGTTLSSSAQSIPQLLSESSIAITPESVQDPTVTRFRAVDVNLELLNESEVGDEIILNLFDDATFTATLEKKEATPTNGYALKGHLDGIQHSQFILIVGGDQIAGNITLPGTFYEIRYTSDNVHAVYQIDQSAYPQEAEPVVPEE